MTDFAAPSDLNAESGLYWATRDAVRVCEYWVKRPHERTVARLAGGETIDITEVEPKELQGLSIIAERKVRSHKVEHYLLSGEEVLEGPNQWAGRYIPIFPVIGSETPLETKVIRSGLIRFSRDPQQLYNFWRSAAAEAIALAPRAPFVATPSMIAKFKGQWDTQNTVSRPYLLYEPDPDVPGGRPMREPPPDVPGALINESGMASDDMKATTGIYDASLGAQSNEISGIAIRARTGQGDISALHYQDNLMATLHHLGRVLIDLIPKIYDSERSIRIMREDETHLPVRINVPVMGVNGERSSSAPCGSAPPSKPMLLNDLSQGSYDVRVKIGPSYATRRAEAADSMLQFIQAVPQAASVAGDLIARNMDWPGADEIADRLKRMLPPQVTGETPPLGAQLAAAEQQAYSQALAEAHLGRAQGLAAQAGANAAKAHAEAQDAAMHTLSSLAATLSGTPLAPQDAMQAALQEAALRERQASAAKAEAELQAKVLDNGAKRAQLSGPSPYKLYAAQTLPDRATEKTCTMDGGLFPRPDPSPMGEGTVLQPLCKCPKWPTRRGGLARARDRVRGGTFVRYRIPAGPDASLAAERRLKCSSRRQDVPCWNDVKRHACRRPAIGGVLPAGAAGAVLRGGRFYRIAGGSAAFRRCFRLSGPKFGIARGRPAGRFCGIHRGCIFDLPAGT